MIKVTTLLELLHISVTGVLKHYLYLETPHEPPVSLPYNSLLMKFDILPKNIPIVLCKLQDLKDKCSGFLLFANMKVLKLFY